MFDQGKAGKPYDYCVESAVVPPLGNPRDGYVLSAVLEQAIILTHGVGLKTKRIVVDLGLRGVDIAKLDREIVH